MADITGSTLYVLGAGASYHAGAPLLATFLTKARLLLESQPRLRHRDSFQRVFQWIDSLRASSYYVEVDLDNLEHVFSIAELGYQILLADFDQPFSDLGYLVMETLDNVQLQVNSSRIEPDATYSSFAKQLAALHADRDDRTREARRDGHPLEHDGVITFNYDVMLDYVMNFHGVGFDYHVEAPPPGVLNFPLLKLHGSTNWATCRNCGNPWQMVKPTPIPPGKTLGPMFPGDRSAIRFAMVTDVMAQTPCSKCQTVGRLEPVVIPPTWSKRVAGSPLGSVWRRAIEAIQKASQIVVIGYSLPPTDTFFQYLLAVGLGSNAGLHRVVVVDLDQSEAFRERYRRVFSRSLDGRGKLKFLTGITFEHFVRAKMKWVGRDIQWRDAS